MQWLLTLHLATGFLLTLAVQKHCFQSPEAYRPCLALCKQECLLAKAFAALEKHLTDLQLCRCQGDRRDDFACSLADEPHLPVRPVHLCGGAGVCV